MFGGFVWCLDEGNRSPISQLRLLSVTSKGEAIHLDPRLGLTDSDFIALFPVAFEAITVAEPLRPHACLLIASGPDSRCEAVGTMLFLCLHCFLRETVWRLNKVMRRVGQSSFLWE